MTEFLSRFILLISGTLCASAFIVAPYTVILQHPFRLESNHGQRISFTCRSLSYDNEDIRISHNEEAERLLAKARALRSEIPEDHGMKTTSSTVASKWNLKPNDESEGVDYRLYVDIGREDGTWMDPRWGASGRRIEFTLDTRFLTPSSTNSSTARASKEDRDKMTKDNLGGSSSHVWKLKTALFARLRKGFDEMECHGGAYRIDGSQSNQRTTVRFYVVVDGTKEQGSSYGDIYVPKGCLYFSLPTFGGIERLSKKEGIVSVRQIGWHTGWRREESRIVGTFRALPINEAKAKDGF
jgi:hypothetical protein